jgi:hypothetical protein
MCPLPRRIERVLVLITSPFTRLSPHFGRVGIRIMDFEMLWGVRERSRSWAPDPNQRSNAMANQNDLSRSGTEQHDYRGYRNESELLANRGDCARVDRHPLKKLNVDEKALLQSLRRWRDAAAKAGYVITRMAVALRRHQHGGHSVEPVQRSRALSRVSPSLAAIAPARGGPRRLLVGALAACSRRRSPRPWACIFCPCSAEGIDLLLAI